MKRKKILFNLIYPTKDIGGGWNYIQNFINAIFSNERSTEYEFYALCNSESQELIQEHLEETDIQVCLTKSSSKNYLKRFYYENIYTKKYVREHGIDIQHWFGNVASPISETKNLITIHDLLFWNDYSNIPRRLYQKNILRLNSTFGENILLPISNKTKSEFIDKIGKPHLIGDVLPNPLPDNYGRVNRHDLAAFRNKYNLREKYLLYVSHTYKHKNHVNLVKAFKTIIKEGRDVQLVFRGDPKNNHNRVIKVIREEGVQEYIKWLPRLSDYEMQCLYSGALAMVFPSKYEGGGIPLMEAFACGCPVLCSNLKVFKEFYAEVPMYFNPDKVESIKEKLQVVLTNKEELTNKTNSLKDVVSEFRYANISSQIIDIY